jgi:hypothetical protein
VQIVARIKVGARPVHIYSINQTSSIWSHSDAEGSFYVIPVNNSQNLTATAIVPVSFSMRPNLGCIAPYLMATSVTSSHCLGTDGLAFSGRINGLCQLPNHSQYTIIDKIVRNVVGLSAELHQCPGSRKTGCKRRLLSSQLRCASPGYFPLQQVTQTALCHVENNFGNCKTPCRHEECR